MRIKSIKTHRKCGIFLVYFSLAIVAWSFFYPALNWPDEAYKVYQIGIDPNVYLSALSFLTSDYCDLAYTLDTTKGYLSNSFVIEMVSGHGCYYLLKAVNAIFIVGITAVCLVLAREKWRQELIMLSLIWPSSLFYVTGINQHIFFHVISISIIAMAIGQVRIWGYLLASLGLVAVDRSFVSLLVFLGFLSILRMRPKYTVILTIMLFGTAEFARPIIGSTSMFLNEGKTIAELSQSVSQYHDSWLVSFGLFFVSFVYLGGTSSVYGFIIEYGFVLIVVICLIASNRREQGMKVYLAAFLLTYVFVVSYIPTLQTFRYYAYIMPAVIFYLLRPVKYRTYYVAYSVLFSSAYLIQSSV